MEQHLVGIYKIINPSGAVYIGQSFHIMRRWRQYKSLRNCRLQPKLFASLTKYGADNHKFEILCLCTHQELNEKEKYFIELFQSFNTKKGLNLKIGGEQKGILSEESKLKMRNSHLGVKLSEYHRKRQGDGKRGEKHYLYGKHRSEETKEKLRQARLRQPCPRTGKTHSDKTKLQISIAKTGSIISPEHRNKTSIALKKAWAKRKLEENFIYLHQKEMA